MSQQLKRNLKEKTPEIRCIQEERRIVRITAESDVAGQVGVLFEDGRLHVYYRYVDEAPTGILALRTKAEDVTWMGLRASGVLTRPSPDRRAHSYYEAGSTVQPRIEDMPDQPQVCGV